MNLAFFDIDLDNEEQKREFMDLNSIAHRMVNDAISVTGVIPPGYCLDYPAVTPDFLLLNAADEIAWARALGLTAPEDAATINPLDRGEVRDWLNNQQLFMEQVATTLNL